MLNNQRCVQLKLYNNLKHKANIKNSLNKICETRNENKGKNNTKQLKV